jgi:predicted negative regulator of RcsB-dependent stress response
MSEQAAALLLVVATIFSGLTPLLVWIFQRRQDKSHADRADMLQGITEKIEAIGTRVDHIDECTDATKELAQEAQLSAARASVNAEATHDAVKDLQARVGRMEGHLIGRPVA